MNVRIGWSLRGALRAALFFLLATLGCDDAPITSVLFRLEDPWSFAQTGADLPVVVRGEPYPLAAVDPAEVIARAMRQAASWTATPPFVANQAAKGLRIVYLFNQPAGAELCRTLPAGGPPQSGGRIGVVAAFCSGTDPIAVVNGRLGASSGIDDPRFSRLIRQMTLDLLRPPSAHRP